MVVLAAAALFTACSDSDNNGGGSTPPPVVNPPPPPPPPPPAPTKVIGTVSTTTGPTTTAPLDQYVKLDLVAQSGTRVSIPVSATGTFSVDAAAGMYTVVAARPGYEKKEQAGFTVTANQNNTLNISLTALPAVTYIGHDDCAVCHKALYDGYIQSAHPHKIRKVVDGKQPQYPPFIDRTPAFSKLTGCQTGSPLDGGRKDIPCPKGWEDIAYTLGGSYKLRFILKDGYVMSGTRGQYDVPGTSYISNRFPADGNASAYTGQRYDCGGCHTTGFKYKVPQNQDGLPGIRGAWKFDGVQCEACHGAGARHAQTMNKSHITRKAGPRRTVAELQSADEGFGKAIPCYECHGRDSNRNLRDGKTDWSSDFDKALAARGIVPRLDPQGGRIRGTSSGLIDARSGDQTWTYWPAAPANKAPGRTAPIPADQELTMARSASFLGSHGDCSTCHNPHASARPGRFLVNKWYTGPENVDRSNEACMTCHSLFNPKLRSGGMQNLQCVDCHAPYVSFNGMEWPASGKRPPLGDLPGHIWKIDLGLDRPTNDPLPQYTNELLATPAKTGFIYPYMTIDFACRSCHHGEAPVANLNGLDVPGSYPASFNVNVEMLKFLNFRFHNNLPVGHSKTTPVN